MGKRKRREQKVEGPTVVWRYLPVVVERSAPNSEEENLHQHKGEDAVTSQGLDHPVLLQADTVGAEVEIVLAKSVAEEELLLREAMGGQPVLNDGVTYVSLLYISRKQPLMAQTVNICVSSTTSTSLDPY